MALRFLSIFALVLATTPFMSCSGGGGGGGGGGASSTAACTDPGAFCLVDCNLGCNFRGCGLTDIAQNQPLIFNFSREIDPASVGFGSISLKTSTGAEPVGNFFVEGASVTFIPDVLNIGGAAFFGFTAGETYFLEVGGAGSTTPLRSTSGDVLAEPIRCSVDVSLGVVDLDGKPPQVKVLSPVMESDVPLNTTVVLEFDELIDHGAFFGLTGLDAPITYQMRKTTIDSVSGRLVCLPSSSPRVLPGEPQLIDDKIRGVTTVSFTPLQTLPGNGCLEVTLTSAVRDLAGTPAQPLIFRFTTEFSNQPSLTVDETFDDDLMLDVNRSTGSWSSGSGVFGLHGGDGRHGDFDFTDGVALDEDELIWEWKTDGQLIVSDEDLSNNWLNQSLQVNDGVFQFTDFFLPEEITLIFTGRNPARIFVRGRCEIFGKIYLNAEDRLELWDGKMLVSGTPVPALPQLGQRGSSGGPGGGGGGRGGSTEGPPGTPPVAGAQGTDVRLLPGHVYFSRRALTAGRGGPLVPDHGDPALVDYTTPNPPAFPVPQDLYSQYISGGGSGGGLRGPGQNGLAIQNGAKTELFPPITIPTVDPSFFDPNGPEVPGGQVFDFLPKPVDSSSDHYVIGGSGGGGGGSHALFARKAQVTGALDAIIFSSGAGGAGGGGAIAFRAGRSLVMGGAALIECKGGSAADQSRLPRGFPPHWLEGIASPGGGGSGGSVLFMVDGTADMQGLVDVSPGMGGVARLDLPALGQNSKYVYHTRGGDGGSGYIRLETSDLNPNIGVLGSHVPAGAGDVATITEEWSEVAFQSLWYETNQIFAPLYERYEIEAEIDGNTVIYSDDPAVGVLAQHVTTPLAFYIQGADIVSGSGQVLFPGEVQGWRRYVGSFNPVPDGPSLNGDNKNGFRWVLILDRTFGVDVVIKRVSIVFKP